MKLNARYLTLTEILVVLSVLMLLLSLLSSSFSHLVQRSRQFSCLSSLKSFNLIWITYTDDHYGMVMPVHDGPGEGYTGYRDYISPYELDWHKGCPDIGIPKSTVPWAAHRASYGIWHLTRSNSKADYALWNINELSAKPENAVNFVECWAVLVQNFGLLNVHEIGRTLFTSWGAYRHASEGLNFSYIDGHAKFLNIADFGALSRYSDIPNSSRN